jgi:hypothetical protein
MAYALLELASLIARVRLAVRIQRPHVYDTLQLREQNALTRCQTRVAA